MLNGKANLIQHSTLNIQHSTLPFGLTLSGPRKLPPMHFPLSFDPRTWHWDLLAAFGFVAQAVFAGRFLVQWISSERRKMSHVPVEFWYLSLSGGILMTIYGLARRDPVIIFGQAPGLIVYIRNLMLIRTARSRSL
jgi:lipid-A-disaccharide synthase-like uncharacterized protein